MPKLSEEKYKKIISDYLSGMTQKEVGKLNGVGDEVVGAILRRFDVPVRSYTGERQHNRKWIWDYAFFAREDPLTAYWAGFMMADGSVTAAGKNTGMLIFYLQEMDIDHVYSFCDHIGLSREAIYRRPPHDASQEAVGIQLTHRDILSQMQRWGVIPRKTYNFIEPSVPDGLLPHYLRGWVDGDGYVYANGTGARISVCGNKLAMEWFIRALRGLGYTGNVSYKERSDTHGIVYVGGRDQTTTIIDLLQAKGNFKLERKWITTYEPNDTTFTHICEICARPFEVKKYRHEHESEHGRFCSKKCRDIDQWNQHHIIENGTDKRKCARCGEYKPPEEFSANVAYCKVCWRERSREYRANRKAG